MSSETKQGFSAEHVPVSANGENVKNQKDLNDACVFPVVPFLVQFTCPNKKLTF